MRSSAVATAKSSAAASKPLSPPSTEARHPTLAAQPLPSNARRLLRYSLLVETGTGEADHRSTADRSRRTSSKQGSLLAGISARSEGGKTPLPCFTDLRLLPPNGNEVEALARPRSFLPLLCAGGKCDAGCWPKVSSLFVGR
nr:hypothetical protein Itr_chr03CG00910 [Ipomoea trifida]